MICCKRMRPTIVISSLIFLCSPFSSPSTMGTQKNDPRDARVATFASAEARQFDFWIGEWDVLNRFWQPAKGWVEGGRATAKVYSILNGLALIEHWQGELGGSAVNGFSVRAYDAAKQKWVLVLNWPSKDSAGFFTLDGEFRHGRGEFFRDSKTPDGKPSRARYTFSDVSDKSFRWDSAFSTDNGSAWQTYWIMEFTRRDAKSQLPLFNGPARSNSLCSKPEPRELDFMIGEWEGTRQTEQADNDRKESRVRLRSLAILEGCAVMDFLEGEGDEAYRGFRIRAYDGSIKKWVQYGIDNENPTFARLEGDYKEGALEFRTTQTAETNEPLSRTSWSQPDKDSLILESARSTDNGKRWKVTTKITLKRRK